MTTTILFLVPSKYDPSIAENQYLPDTRANAKPPFTWIEGFGLIWATSTPPREASIRKCQKLLEVDRNMKQTNGDRGLLGWLNRQKNSVNDRDSMRLIGLKKKFSLQHKVTAIIRTLSGKPSGK